MVTKENEYHSMIQKIRTWGKQKASIHYILQSDLKDSKGSKNFSTLKFFISTENSAALIKNSNWLGIFGKRVREHTAHYGHFLLAKAVYENGYELHFIIVERAKNAPSHDHYDLDRLDTTKRLLVSNGV